MLSRRSTGGHKTMNKKFVQISVTAVGAVATGLLLLHVRIAIPVDSLIGYAAVLVTVGVAAIDYRFNSRRPLIK